MKKVSGGCAFQLTIALALLIAISRNKNVIKGRVKNLALNNIHRHLNDMKCKTTTGCFFIF